jgi:hypothetical protein
MPECWMSRAAFEQIAQRWNTLDREPIVPDHEEKLMRQVGEAIDDWRRCDQQRRPAHQPDRHVLVPFSEPVSEMVALVDYDQVSGASR